MKKIIALTSLIMGLTSINNVNAQQALKFADIFTDNMVLQRGTDIKCWGWAKPGVDVEVMLTQSKEEVLAFVGKKALAQSEKETKTTDNNPKTGKVRIAYVEEDPIDFKTVTKTATADKDGLWEVKLGKQKASFTPKYLAAKSGDESVVLKNILIGEVWVASGQSNMSFGNTRDKMWENKGLIFNGLRFIDVSGDSYTPRESLASSGWIECEDGKVQGLATIPYLFGQNLHRQLKVPVGIIKISMGGSYAREWCDRELLEKMDSPTVNEDIKEHDKKVKNDPSTRDSRGPSSLFNARFYPFRKLDVAGVIYLQGENEALCGDLPQYVKTFPGVIESYRKAMGKPDLPFGIITLQGMGSKKGLGQSSYSVAREIHQNVHKKKPNTGYVVAHDIGGGIHPSWKRPLAERAVYWALRDVYKVIDQAKKTQIKSVTFSNGEALVEFEQYELKDGKWVNPKPIIPGTNNQDRRAGFMIAGKDGEWFPGCISIQQEKPIGLIISNPMVKNPVALRYGWEGWSNANLGQWFDPIPPYRTDDWKIVEKDEIYNAQSDRLNPAQISYYKLNKNRNRELLLPLQMATEESKIKLTKRYAHPKEMLLETVRSMKKLVHNFDVESYNKLAPELRMLALHNIPCRYWRRDRYSPARRAKWGWYIERILRLENLPQDMKKTVTDPGVKAKLSELENALSGLEQELQKLPDAGKMDFDTMLDKILVVMEKEKERLSKEGVDMEKQKRALSKNRF